MHPICRLQITKSVKSIHLQYVHCVNEQPREWQDVGVPDEKGKKLCKKIYAKRVSDCHEADGNLTCIEN